MTIIQSAGNSIESQTDNQQIRDEVSQLQAASRRLLHLVDSVVDITNISIRPVDEAQWCHDDIVGYVRMLVEAYRHEAAKRQIRLVVTSKRNKIEADFVPDYVDKILGNLLTDMLHHAYNQSDLYISMSIERRMLRLELKDRGQGMSPEVVKDLLKPYDSKNTSEIYMHVGLNIQAVQAAIRAMGGDIKLKSKLGEYAQFIITIPLRHGDHDYPRLTEQKTLHTPAALSPADADMPPVVEAEADNKPRILIVEESAQVARYVADQLKDHYKVFFASNGEDGLHKIRIAAPDLIITDGGKGQMDVVSAVVNGEMGLNIAVAGLAKDDRHRTRALITARGHELGIQQTPALFALIGTVQEEVHRFAIAYHHQKHTKSAKRSQLDNIPGVGEARKKKLLQHFGTVTAVKNAALEQLSAVVPEAAARAVYEKFHG